MSKEFIELDSQTIMNIVMRVIIDHSVHGEDGEELSEDLYLLRANDLDELAWDAAKRVHQAAMRFRNDRKAACSDQ